VTAWGNCSNIARRADDAALTLGKSGQEREHFHLTTSDVTDRSHHIGIPLPRSYCNIRYRTLSETIFGVSVRVRNCRLRAIHLWLFDSFRSLRGALFSKRQRVLGVPRAKLRIATAIRKACKSRRACW